MTITNKRFRGTDTLTDCPCCDNQFWQRPQGIPLTCGYRCGQILRATQRPTLTPREVEVRALIDAGLTHLQIAARLGITRGTVKNISSALGRKLEAHDALV